MTDAKKHNDNFWREVDDVRWQIEHFHNNTLRKLLLKWLGCICKARREAEDND